MYGAKLHLVPGTREDTARATLEAAEGSYYASHYWNPFFLQGTKTFAFEVWEQLGFGVPNILFIPTGHGTLFIGAYLGFRDLLRQKLIARMPKLVAVQAEGCAPLHQMYREGLTRVPAVPREPTMAEGIAIARPLRWAEILTIVRETGGDIMVVGEGEIVEALFELARMGLYVEPTSAAAFAGFKKYPGGAGEQAIVPLTGSGLKSTEKHLELLKKAKPRQPLIWESRCLPARQAWR